MNFRAEIQTDLDLSKIAEGIIIPEKTMKDIGLAYRKHREEKMRSGVNLHDLSPMTPLKAKTIERKRKKGSRSPQTPLIDTGNMSRGVKMRTGAGFLEITQGTTRAEIQAYHQEGAGVLPQRVTLSWNKDFLESKVKPIIRAYLKTLMERAKKRG